MGAFPRWVSLYFCKLTLVFSWFFFFQVQVWILTGPLQHPHSFLLQSFSAWQLIWGYVCTKDVIQEGLQLAEMQICKQAVLLPTNLVFHRAMNSVKEFLFHIFVASGLKWKVLDVEKFLILPCYFFYVFSFACFLACYEIMAT